MGRDRDNFDLRRDVDPSESTRPGRSTQRGRLRAVADTPEQTTPQAPAPRKDRPGTARTLRARVQVPTLAPPTPVAPAELDWAVDTSSAAAALEISDELQRELPAAAADSATESGASSNGRRRPRRALIPVASLIAVATLVVIAIVSTQRPGRPATTPPTARLAALLGRADDAVGRSTAAAISLLSVKPYAPASRSRRSRARRATNQSSMQSNSSVRSNTGSSSYHSAARVTATQSYTPPRASGGSSSPTATRTQTVTRPSTHTTSPAPPTDAGALGTCVQGCS